MLGSGARLAGELGWTPRIPIERTLADLLDYWRGVVPAESGRRGMPPGKALAFELREALAFREPRAEAESR